MIEAIYRLGVKTAMLKLKQLAWKGGAEALTIQLLTCFSVVVGRLKRGIFMDVFEDLYKNLMALSPCLKDKQSCHIMGNKKKIVFLLYHDQKQAEMASMRRIAEDVSRMTHHFVSKKVAAKSKEFAVSKCVQQSMFDGDENV